LGKVLRALLLVAIPATVSLFPRASSEFRASFAVILALCNDSAFSAVLFLPPCAYKLLSSRLLLARCLC